MRIKWRLYGSDPDDHTARSKAGVFISAASGCALILLTVIIWDMAGGGSRANYPILVAWIVVALGLAAFYYWRSRHE